MRNPSNAIGVSLTDNHKKLLGMLKDNGYFPSMASVIRYCINYATPKLLKEIKELNIAIEKNDVLNIITKLKEFGYVIHKGNQATKAIPIISITNNGVNIPIQ